MCRGYKPASTCLISATFKTATVMFNSSRAISTFIAVWTLTGPIKSQCDFPDMPPEPGFGMSTLYESKYGHDMPTSGVVRILLVLVEVDYANPTDDPMPNGSATWPAHQKPVWVDNV